MGGEVQLSMKIFSNNVLCSWARMQRGSHHDDEEHKYVYNLEKIVTIF